MDIKDLCRQSSKYALLLLLFLEAKYFKICIQLVSKLTSPQPVFHLLLLETDNCSKVLIFNYLLVLGLAFIATIEHLAHLTRI